MTTIALMNMAGAMSKRVQAYCKKNNIIKESDGAFTGDDVLEGLMAVVSVKLREIQRQMLCADMMERADDSTL